MSAANWAETLSKVADNGNKPESIINQLQSSGIFGKCLAVVPLTGADAVDIANLRNATRARGLSLGDRACLSLAIKTGLAALTTDRSWTKLKTGAQIRVIR